MRRHQTLIALLGALALGGFGCGDDGGAETPEATAETTPTAETPTPAPAEQPTTPPPAAAAGESNFGTVSLTTGFMPDPHEASGTSGGSTEASSLDGACAGWVDSTPDHLFVAQGDFSNLRVLAHSDTDITLVIQKPDGTYMCNDDAEGTDPIVEGTFPAGTYKVFIGSYEQGQNASYQLGFTELATATAASLAD